MSVTRKLMWSNRDWEARILEVARVTVAEFESMAEQDALDLLEAVQRHMEPSELKDAMPHLRRLAGDVQRRGGPVGASAPTPAQGAKPADDGLAGFRAALDTAAQAARVRAADLAEINRLSARLLTAITEASGPAATIGARSRGSSNDVELALSGIRTEVQAWQGRVAESHRAELASLRRGVVDCLIRRNGGDVRAVLLESPEILAALGVSAIEYAAADDAERVHFRVLAGERAQSDVPALVSGVTLLREGVHYQSSWSPPDDRS